MALPAVLLLALAAVLVVLVLRKLLGGGTGGRGSTVLLVGPCEGGKTTMWHQLLQGSTHLGTVASMQPNVGEGPLAGEKAAAASAGASAPRPVQLVDIPGHPRLRGQLERHAERAAGVVFVLDSVDFMPKKTETAEQLLEVLSSPALAKRRAPVLLACNKQDAGSRAHTVEFIRKRLEKELDQLRSTRGTLGDVNGGSGGGGAPLGAPGEPFTFESHARAHGVRVTTAGVSAVDRGGVAEVEAFIRRCVPA
ncbi:signal recognition particle receptor subunit beta-like [Micractinium conductrix]|uniref:Signal recognition particle receptor subunit beta n=1 Tax=Micractinium conductrix TaxID=554055 RepID=A0A2P6V4C1_9CHLO|nr:signal recognition particle receptor subunit beta-like [Micractinium conductrix]|eukprot:PSC68940.1 signal recognition particle receptor subunit beta-like [Micractinium conductrix]